MSLNLCLWEHNEKKLHRVTIEGAGRPSHIEYEGKTYYTGMATPLFYTTPATDDAFLTLFSLYMQTQKTETLSRAVLNQTDPLDVFEEQYHIDLNREFPAALMQYLYEPMPYFSLQDDHIGIFQNYTYRQFFHAFLEKMIIAEKLESKRIIEIGCGKGEHLLFLKSRFPQAEIHGVEPTASGLAKAERASKHWGLNIHWHKSNAEEIPAALQNEKFDLVFCHSVLQLPKIRHEVLLKNMCSLARSYIALFDVFPELWEPGTARTLASLSYLQMNGFSSGILVNILSKTYDLPATVIKQQRLHHSWNPLTEPSMVLLKTNT